MTVRQLAIKRPKRGDDMDADRMLRVDQAVESLGTQLSAERRNSRGHQDANRQRCQITRPKCTPIPERHLYRIPEAMQLLSMSRSVIYEQIRSGHYGPTTACPSSGSHAW